MKQSLSRIEEMLASLIAERRSPTAQTESQEVDGSSVAGSSLAAPTPDLPDPLKSSKLKSMDDDEEEPPYQALEESPKSVGDDPADPAVAKELISSTAHQVFDELSAPTRRKEIEVRKGIDESSPLQGLLTGNFSIDRDRVLSLTRELGNVHAMTNDGDELLCFDPGGECALVAGYGLLREGVMSDSVKPVLEGLQFDRIFSINFVPTECSSTSLISLNHIKPGAVDCIDFPIFDLGDSLNLRRDALKDLMGDRIDISIFDPGGGLMLKSLFILVCHLLVLGAFDVSLLSNDCAKGFMFDHGIRYKGSWPLRYDFFSPENATEPLVDQDTFYTSKSKSDQVLSILDPGRNLLMLTVADFAIYLMELSSSHHGFRIPLLVASTRELTSTEAKSSTHVQVSPNDSTCAAGDPYVLLIYVPNGSESDVLKQLNLIGVKSTVGKSCSEAYLLILPYDKSKSFEVAIMLDYNWKKKFLGLDLCHYFGSLQLTFDPGGGELVPVGSTLNLGLVVLKKLELSSINEEVHDMRLFMTTWYPRLVGLIFLLLNSIRPRISIRCQTIIDSSILFDPGGKWLTFGGLALLLLKGSELMQKTLISKILVDHCTPILATLQEDGYIGTRIGRVIIHYAAKVILCASNFLGRRAAKICCPSLHYSYPLLAKISPEELHLSICSCSHHRVHDLCLQLLMCSL